MKAERFIVKRSPSNQLWFATRGLSRDPREAEATLRKHRLHAWNERDKTPATKFIPVGGKTWGVQPAAVTPG